MCHYVAYVSTIGIITELHLKRNQNFVNDKELLTEWEIKMVEDQDVVTKKTI